MKENLTHTHAGIEITYNEATNRWVFECRGRERSSESLALAKTAIDKPEPNEKPPFKRTTAIYRKSYGGDFAVVDITSIAQPPKYGSDHCVYYWATDPNPKLGHRGKTRDRISSNSLCANTPANHAIVAKITELIKLENDLEEQRNRLVNTMAKFKPESV